MSEFKQIQLTGEAATVMTPAKGRRRTRKNSSLNVTSSGGGGGLAPSPAPIQQLVDNQVDMRAIRIINTSPTNNPSVPHVTPNSQIPEIPKQIPLVEANKTPQMGGADTKIVLAPKKKREGKVILTRKRKNIGNSTLSMGQLGGKRKGRKVSLNITRHRRRLTKAQKVSKETKNMPIDQIKKKLIEKKLIKATSKAPESVLRQMYTDAIVVSQKAL
jgi:hypothetical protein